MVHRYSNQSALKHEVNISDVSNLAYNLLSLLCPEMKRLKVIYPGSFDPLTNGHLDLIERGSKMFDELVVAVLRNAEKDPLFSERERIEMLEATTKKFPTVVIDTFDGLLVDYVNQQ